MKKLTAASLALTAGAAGLTGTSAEAASTVPAANLQARCLAGGVAKLPINARGVPARASRTAHTLHDLARHCARTGLVRLGNADKTRVSFGDQTPAQIFRLPQTADRPYDNLLRALSARPAALKEGKVVSYVWPRLAAGDNYKNRAAWQEAVRAGLITQKYADRAWRTDKAYYGWRLFVNADGTWDMFVAGD